VCVRVRVVVVVQADAYFGLLNRMVLDATGLSPAIPLSAQAPSLSAGALAATRAMVGLNIESRYYDARIESALAFGAAPFAMPALGSKDLFGAGASAAAMKGESKSDVRVRHDLSALLDKLLSALKAREPVESRLNSDTDHVLVGYLRLLHTLLRHVPSAVDRIGAKDKGGFIGVTTVFTPLPATNTLRL
jgi:hypothetical protein